MTSNLLLSDLLDTLGLSARDIPHSLRTSTKAGEAYAAAYLKLITHNDSKAITLLDNIPDNATILIDI